MIRYTTICKSADIFKAKLIWIPRKYMRLPYWLPNIRSWVNAVALILLMVGISYLMQYALIIILFFLGLVPWLKGAFVFLLFLFPIATVALLHHWFNRFLDNYFPESRIPEEQATVGFFPSLFSWWEGVFGWSIDLFSTYFAFYLLGVFGISPYSSNLLSILNENWCQYTYSLPSVRFTILQIIVAAYLYQLEFLVRQRLIAANRQEI